MTKTLLGMAGAFCLGWAAWTTYLLAAESDALKAAPEVFVCFDARGQQALGERFSECRTVRALPLAGER